MKIETATSPIVIEMRVPKSEAGPDVAAVEVAAEPVLARRGLPSERSRGACRLADVVGVEGDDGKDDEAVARRRRAPRPRPESTSGARLLPRATISRPKPTRKTSDGRVQPGAAPPRPPRSARARRRERQERPRRARRRPASSRDHERARPSSAPNRRRPEDDAQHDRARREPRPRRLVPGPRGPGRAAAPHQTGSDEEDQVEEDVDAAREHECGRRARSRKGAEPRRPTPSGRTGTLKARSGAADGHESRSPGRSASANMATRFFRSCAHDHAPVRHACRGRRRPRRRARGGRGARHLYEIRGSMTA